MKHSPDYFFHKGGMTNVTRFFAADLGPQGIRVNCLSPGGFFNHQDPVFVERYNKMTMMDRMAAKGLLETERIRKMILFSPGIKRVQAQRAELMRTVKRAFNGAFSPMVEFLLDDNKFSKEELEHLKELLHQKSTKKGTRKPKK